MTDPIPARDLRRTVTCILSDLQAGRHDASDQLLPLVYDQLRAIAQQRMNDERAGHTLQATALVHEAYLRLIGDGEMAWADRSHFYAAAAPAMRRILIDHARRRAGQARAATGVGLPLDVASLALDENLDGNPGPRRGDPCAWRIRTDGGRGRVGHGTEPGGLTGDRQAGLDAMPGLALLHHLENGEETPDPEASFPPRRCHVNTPRSVKDIFNEAIEQPPSAGRARRRSSTVRAATTRSCAPRSRSPAPRPRPAGRVPRRTRRGLRGSAGDECPAARREAVGTVSATGSCRRSARAGSASSTWPSSSSRCGARSR